jgi:hypothetical protein
MHTAGARSIAIRRSANLRNIVSNSYRAAGPASWCCGKAVAAPAGERQRRQRLAVGQKTVERAARNPGQPIDFTIERIGIRWRTDKRRRTIAAQTFVFLLIKQGRSPFRIPGGAHDSDHSGGGHNEAKFVRRQRGGYARPMAQTSGLFARAVLTTAGRYSPPSLAQALAAALDPPIFGAVMLVRWGGPWDRPWPAARSSPGDALLGLGPDKIRPARGRPRKCDELIVERLGPGAAYATKMGRSLLLAGLALLHVAVKKTAQKTSYGKFTPFRLESQRLITTIN